MKQATLIGLGFLCATVFPGPAQARQAAVGARVDHASVLDAIHRDGLQNSRIEPLAQYLADVIGPRLTASPGHEEAIDWAMGQLQEWGIQSRREAQGTWRSWERGLAGLDLIEPRARSLEGTLLTWSPGTNGSVTGNVVALPQLENAAAFKRWLPTARGRFVLLTPYEPSCRPAESWAEYGGVPARESFDTRRSEARASWQESIRNTGLTHQQLIDQMEAAGVAGFLTNLWTGERGTDRIFPLTYALRGAMNRTAPAFSLSCEDYGLLYRLAANGQSPRIKAYGEARDLGERPAHNLIAVIPGSELPDEYVVLSAHFDSWDGASGMTDNGTGSVTMMEAMRLLAAHYPKPRRTILLGLWSGEEQGLNGSRGFAADHPEVVEGLQVLLNQDNGTGRIATIDMHGLSGAFDHFRGWFEQLPIDLVRGVELIVPGSPGESGSDYVSFVCSGAPAFNLLSDEFDYRTATWHTNRDTFDKIALKDLKSNATLIAQLAFLASEGERIPRKQSAVGSWPTCQRPDRSTSERFR